MATFAKQAKKKRESGLGNGRADVERQFAMMQAGICAAAGVTVTTTNSGHVQRASTGLNTSSVSGKYSYRLV
jgi:hypothetical protein